MSTFTPKKYQELALASVEAYFRECQQMGSADYAFQETTKALWGKKSDFTPLSGFPENMPYFCLRVPTGGGKTYLAAKSVALVNNRLLHVEHSVILWLVPSKAIRDQTLAGLRQLNHPYHAALREAGPVTVIDLDEAKALTRSTLETSTVVIVATRQAFQVGDLIGRQANVVAVAIGAGQHGIALFAFHQRRNAHAGNDQIHLRRHVFRPVVGVEAFVLQQAAGAIFELDALRRGGHQTFHQGG